MNRLTDDKTAEGIKRICDGLIAAGAEPTMSDLRYVKLAEYEQTGYEPADLVKAVGGCVGFLGLVGEGLQLNKWISVKERLPEEDVQVLVYGTTGLCGTAYMLNGNWLTKNWLVKITHWMPLPKKPKEVQDSGTH